MKKIEQIVILIVLVCFGLYFTEIPYIDMACTIVFILAASFYMFGGWYFLQDKNGVNNMGFSLLVSWIISQSLGASIFIFNLWLGNIKMLYVALFAVAVVVFSLIYLRSKDKRKGEMKKYLNNIMLRILIFTAILFSFYMKFENIINPAIES